MFVGLFFLNFIIIIIIIFLIILIVNYYNVLRPLIPSIRKDCDLGGWEGIEGKTN